MNKEFIEFLKSGKPIEEKQTQSQGGYLLPQYFNVKRKGFLGWIYRLFGSPKGYEIKCTIEVIRSKVPEMGSMSKVKLHDNQ